MNSSAVVFSRVTIVAVGLTCCALLAISLLGDVTSLGQYTNKKHRSWEQFDQELIAATPDVASLIAAAEQQAGRTTTQTQSGALMGALYDVTIRRFAHGPAEHNLFTNWIVWLRGLLRPHPIRVADSDRLLARGHTGLCGQKSQLLADMARQVGIQARMVQFRGHVAMEAYHDGQWRYYDPDAEVSRLPEQVLPMSLNELLEQPELLERLYSPYNLHMLPVIRSTEDNRYADNSESRLQFEQMTDVLKYILPLLGLVLTALSWRWLARQNP